MPAGGITYYLADDQRADEAHSLNFTSDPFETEISLLGWPEVVLFASSSARVATFVVKLSDVAPDGKSALITDGSLNGTRRNSLTDPEDLTPDEVYELNIPMQPTGWVLKPGHRLRMSISGSDFPNLWPTPELARHRIHEIVLSFARLECLELGGQVRSLLAGQVRNAGGNAHAIATMAGGADCRDSRLAGLDICGVSHRHGSKCCEHYQLRFHVYLLDLRRSLRASRVKRSGP